MSQAPLDLSPAKQALLAQRLRQARRQPDKSPAISPRPAAEIVPLSFAQERLWFLEQFEPGQPIYNRPLAIHLTGWLNIAALERSLSEILGRHEVLRMTFASGEGQPRPTIAPAQPIKLPLVDLSKLPPAEREGPMIQLAMAEAGQPFDLTQAPLLRAILLRLDQRAHVLLLVVHRLAFDGWSAHLLLDELVTLYAAFNAGKPSPLPELPIQYADFAYWQRRRLAGDLLASQLAYWQDKLAGAPELDLPTDYSRPPHQSYQGACQTLLLPALQVQELKALSQQEGVTLFMTLLAAFKLLLYRYTGQPDMVIGSPIAGRTRVETEGLIGFFINTLVLRTDLSGQPTFRELLRRVRQVALAAYAHQDLPFEKLAAELGRERDPRRQPLFQVMFNLENIPRQASQTEQLTFAEFEFDSGVTSFDLHLEIVKQDQALLCLFYYRTDLFEPATITHMSEHFQALLAELVANPELRLASLPLLTKVDRPPQASEPTAREITHLAPPSLSIGRPLANVQIYLLDANRRLVPIGVPGEVYIGGAGLARGYLNRPELTAEKFIPNPFSPSLAAGSDRDIGARLYKTGDLARYLPDGRLEFLGRIDDQVKIRGFRIEPGEIEAILRQHPAVQEVVVLAREDSPGDKRLVAYVVLAGAEEAKRRRSEEARKRGDEETDHITLNSKPETLNPEPETQNLSTELRHFLKAKLPDYMLPAAFVLLEALPLTPNGKVDRRALPVPDQSRSEGVETFVAPRTPVEERVAGIWTELLRLDRVGVNDNFFELGGHSLLATQVISRLRSAFQVDLPLRRLFESPTIAELARFIEASRNSSVIGEPPAIKPVSRQAYRVKRS